MMAGNLAYRKYFTQITLAAMLLLHEYYYGQTRNIRVNVTDDFYPDRVEIKLNSQVENLNTCSVQILDSAKKLAKEMHFPKAIPKPRYQTIYGTYCGCIGPAEGPVFLRALPWKRMDARRKIQGGPRKIILNFRALTGIL